MDNRQAGGRYGVLHGRAACAHTPCSNHVICCPTVPLRPLHRLCGGALTHPLVSSVVREQELARLVVRRQLLSRCAHVPAALASAGTVHRALAQAILASKEDGLPGGWLGLREHTALRVLAGCQEPRARAIRFRSHEWSNELLAQSDHDDDEDLADLAESFCIDTRIMLGALAGTDIPPVSLRLADQLWHVYHLGGWPCGWSGTLTGGRMQIYLRPVGG